jgi:hypothetical protein
MLRSSEPENTAQKDELKKTNTKKQNPAPAMLQSSEPAKPFSK